jgi:hypothetical protein
MVWIYGYDQLDFCVFPTWIQEMTKKIILRNISTYSINMNEISNSIKINEFHFYTRKLSWKKKKKKTIQLGWGK